MDIHKELKEKILSMCAAHGERLLFASCFGSTLYGTAIEGKSDLDVRGIFLPPLADLILGRPAENLHFSTSCDNARNTANDVDIDLWSLQYWLLHLLPAGDTGAMDLLFAPSNQACTIYMDKGMAAIFENQRKFINLQGNGGYASYCIGQAKKYGLRGSRLGALKKVLLWLEDNCPAPAKNERLGQYLDALLRACEDGHHCARVNLKDCRGLGLCGKMHLETIGMAEFAKRVKNQFEQYGQRSILAEQNQGLDYKALSHAVRALEQMKELVATGKIVYPLRSRQELMAIKNGDYSWKELEERIVSGLRDVNGLCANAPGFPGFDMALAENIIIDFYNRKQDHKIYCK